MILEWNDVTRMWDEKSDEISFWWKGVWLNKLSNNCYLNITAKGKFYFEKEYDSRAGFLANTLGQVWITWGEVEDDS